jgi:hypothetical protein
MTRVTAATTAATTVTTLTTTTQTGKGTIDHEPSENNQLVVTAEAEQQIHKKGVGIMRKSWSRGRR